MVHTAPGLSQRLMQQPIQGSNELPCYPPYTHTRVPSSGGCASFLPDLASACAGHGAHGIGPLPAADGAGQPASCRSEAAGDCHRSRPRAGSGAGPAGAAGAACTSPAGTTAHSAGAPTAAAGVELSGPSCGCWLQVMWPLWSRGCGLLRSKPAVVSRLVLVYHCLKKPTSTWAKHACSDMTTGT